VQAAREVRLRPGEGGAPVLGGVDLCDLDRFAAGFPHRLFARLRREAPVAWHPPTPRLPGGEGFWVVSGHAETLEVLRDAETFSSESGGERTAAGTGGTLLEDLPVASLRLLNMMDPPRHTRIRALVNRGFKPRPIAALEPELRRLARGLVDAVVDRGACDFLREVASELPLQAIAGLLGVPQADRHRLFAWTSVLVDYRDRDLGGTSSAFQEATAGLARYAAELLAEKRERPREDLLSLMVHAELPDETGEGGRLSDAEALSFFHLLLVAGSETTRNAIAHGLLALLDHRDELDRLRSDPALLPGAVEEILRWTSPTTYNRRTVTRDARLGGCTVRAGEKVSHWYPSANRDARVFQAPERLDVGRNPNPHLAFGAGQHHCLGAGLARLEVRIVFEELLARRLRIELADEPEWVRSNKHTGLRRLPLRLSPGPG
jgi:cytochrome P450